MRKRKNRLTREDCIRDLSSIQLPRSVSKSIGEIGFLKEHQLEGDEVFYRPIIEIHPKDAPQNVKELWMSMYERAQKGEQSWKHLIYQYGYDNFSLQNPSDIISFQDGCDKDYDAIPLNIMMKLRHEHILCDSDVQVIEALEYMKQELKRDPKDRVNWLLDNEDYSSSNNRTERNRHAVNSEELESESGGFWQCVDEEDGNAPAIMNVDAKSKADRSDLVACITKDSITFGMGGNSNMCPYIDYLENIKDDFYRVGFTMFDGIYFPVIQLSPCDICPSLFTSLFFRTLMEFADAGKSPTVRLVFWYGQSQNEEYREISVIQERDFVSYYEGCSKVKEQDIDDDSRALIEKGIKQAQEDIDRPPCNRLSWFLEQEREKIDQMRSIPAEIKKEFHRIGFSYHQGLFLPVIQLSPFDVTGRVRDRFLAEIRKGIETNATTKRLLFWYGTREKKKSEAFSFVLPSKFITYEEGVRKQNHQLPQKLQDKLDKSRHLTVREKLLVDGLRQMEDDLGFSPIERPHYLLLPNDDDEVEFIFDEIDSDPED